MAIKVTSAYKKPLDFHGDSLRLMDNLISIQSLSSYTDGILLFQVYLTIYQN